MWSWHRPAGLLAAVLALALAGCGFHLRGQVSIPAELQPIHVSAQGGSRVADEVRRTLIRNGVNVVDDRAAARSEIAILDESRQRRVLTVAVDTAQVDEYEVRYTTEWILRETGDDQRPLLPRETIESQRDYTFDRTAVLAKQNEEATLIENMQQDAALNILSRVQAWDPSQIPEPEAVEIEEEVEG